MTENTRTKELVVEQSIKSKIIYRMIATPEISLMIAIVMFGLVVQTQNSVFFTYGNLILVIKASSPTFILATALTIVFVGGGLDLSVGSVAAFGGVVTAIAIDDGMNIVLAILIGIVLTSVVGAISGTLITIFKIPSLIVTLGMLYIIRGVALVVTGAKMIFPLPEAFKKIAQSDFGALPMLTVYAVIAGIITHIVLDHTSYGYQVRAVGGNLEAARGAGIRVRRIQISIYIISGGMAGLTGILITSRVSTGDPSTLVGFELSVISAVIIGGTSLFGAIGRITGTALGTLLLAIITNGLLLMGVSPYWQQIVLGSVVIIAVGIDQFRRSQLWKARNK